MPKVPMDYSKSVIYKICCRDKSITDVYIGSTTNFVKRKTMHKAVCNNEKSKSYNRYVYGFIRENGNWDNFEMIQLEECPCHTKRELEFREEQLRTELNATLNMVRCWTDGKCKIDDCDNNTKQNGICIKHGADTKKYFCKIDGCDNQVQNSGVCTIHGAERIKCHIDGCGKQVVNNGVCKKHGAETKKCKIDGCDTQVVNNGVCQSHGAVIKKCKIDGCDTQVQKNGLCYRHRIK